MLEGLLVNFEKKGAPEEKNRPRINQTVKQWIKTTPISL